MNDIIKFMKYVRGTNGDTMVKTSVIFVTLGPFHTKICQLFKIRYFYQYLQLSGMFHECI